MKETNGITTTAAAADYVQVVTDTPSNGSVEIMPNDRVRHVPTGKELTVVGVNFRRQEVITDVWPFPTVFKLEDCELIEKRYDTEPQTWDQILALKRVGYQNFVDTCSDMYHMMGRERASRA